MTTNNWRTNLGGAISVIGTTLIGVGLIPQLSGLPYKHQVYIALIGFVLSGIGKGVTALFAADAKAVAALTGVVQQHADAINLVPNAPLAAKNPVPATPAEPKDLQP
jgi:ABC-type enterochelin transport system permease subunit